MKKNKTMTNEKDRMSRKAAMTRIGLTALSASTMFILLTKPQSARAQSTIDDPENPGDPIDW
jgi:hypothetical protein